MGRIIELSVDKKTYTIEFNNIALYSVVDIQDKIKNAKTIAEKYFAISELIKCGLMKNHPNITSEEIEKIIVAIGDLEKFMTDMMEVINASVDELKTSKGNAHWVVK